MNSFIPIPEDTDFSLYNVPFGVFSDAKDATHRCATIVGDTVIDLRQLSRSGLLNVPGYNPEWFESINLNLFAGQPLAARRAVREKLQTLFTTGSALETHESLKSMMYPVKDVALHLPVHVGDYTDFCASVHHTTNAGILMKVPGPPLPPAWSHLPIGYHGRASSIVPSGTPIIRPCGLLPSAPGSGEPPSFGPTRSLDMEFEMAAVVGGQGKGLGGRVGTGEVGERVFGLVMMNDWSAREIQGFEMIPLGPFNGKNFGTTISPWIITLDALAPFKTTLSPIPDHKGWVDYLKDEDEKPTFDIPLTMSIQCEGDNQATTVMKSNLRHLSYSFAQLIAHHTISGCPLLPGDLLGSGTISGPLPDSLACMLEITKRGTEPIMVGENGRERRWLEDGDVVRMFARAERRVEEGVCGNVGFGECEGRVEKAVL